MQPPTFADVLEARRRIRPHLAPTPLHRYPALDALVGAEVFVKHENHQPTCAFKVRGGVNLVAQLSDDERRRGVIGASTGNHGQSVAWAARLFGVAARIVVPEGANPGKVAAMRGMGAEVIFHGAKFDDAREHCEALAARHGFRYVHSGDEPHLIAGVGTIALEILEAEPRLDALFVPIGGGSGAAGACIVARAIAPHVRVVGVQAEAAPAAHDSWKAKRLVTAPNRTFAEGLATATAFALPQGILVEQLREFVLVSDAEILQAMRHMLEHAHTLAEGAGAAALAGALRLSGELAGKRIAVVCSGGNAMVDHVRRALES